MPNKDEILNAYAARYGSFLFFGGERIETSGASNIGCWFFVNPVAPVGTGSGTFSGSHTGGPWTGNVLTSNLGDILILSEFVTGGSVAVSKVFAWVGTGGNEGGGTLQDITPAPGGSPAVFSITNSVAIPAPPCWPYTPNGGALGDDIPARAFFEGGINLSAPEFGALAGSCFSSFLVETRSSPSPSATLKDFVLGNFQQCNVGCTKTADPTSVCAGESTMYTYTIPNTNSVALTVTAVDDNGTPGNTADDFSPFDSSGGCVKSAAGTSFVLAANTTATCTLSSGPLTATTTNTLHVTSAGGGDPCDASATVTVKDVPTCSIAGNDPVCGGTTSTYTSTVLPAGGTVTHLWSISGNGTIDGSNTGSSVSVIAGASGSFTVSDHASRDGCFVASDCSKTVTINPIPTVTITKDLACATPNLQLTANVSPGDGTLTFLWSGPGIVSGQGTATVAVNAPGVYSVHVTRNGCANAVDASATVGLCCTNCSP